MQKTADAAKRQIDRNRVAELTAREERAFRERTPLSAAMLDRARRSLAGGVTSSYQFHDPWPVYLQKGFGARVWDVDGNALFDFHNGYGSMVQGHAHPIISAAIASRAQEGTHFCATTEDAVVVAEELQRRWGLPLWRFTNSGTESTMDAIRIARAFTGRDTILKIFGSYHGHHDAVMVSIAVEYDQPVGDPANLASLPYGAGIPSSTVDLTVAAPFNDADALESRIQSLEAEGRKPACLIMEAALMNMRVILPEDGYLERVREITLKHEIILIFDEVKTGLTLAAGGATEVFGVRPDMVTLAKALGGGLPSGAIGGTAEVMSVVVDGSVYQVGTYNGNPLVAAAARASLTQVLTPNAYKRLSALNDALLSGCSQVLERHRLSGYATGIGAKGCVVFSDAKIVDYATFHAHEDHELSDLAWLYNFNRGIFSTPDRDQEWTLSVVHPQEAIDLYIANLDAMATELTK
jgi:glutamate-1-semialdehyde 2,1-aminomutase